VLCRDHTSKALRYGTRSQGISQFCLHTPRTSANGMNHTCLCLSSWSWYSFTDPGGVEGWVGLGNELRLFPNHIPWNSVTVVFSQEPAYTVRSRTHCWCSGWCACLLSLILIAHTHAWLSWPGWLVPYWGGLSAQTLIQVLTGSQCRVTSLIKAMVTCEMIRVLQNFHVLYILHITTFETDI